RTSFVSPFFEECTFRRTKNESTNNDFSAIIFPMSLLTHRCLRTHASQMWKFAVCGGMGFVLDFASLTLFVEVLEMDARIAVILSSVVGASFVFVANKFF